MRSRPRSRSPAGRRTGAKPARRRRSRRPAVDPRPLGRRASTAGASRSTEAIRARARRRRSPSSRRCSAPRPGVVQVPHVGGYVERIQVPPDPDALRRVAAQTGGQLLRGARPRTTSAPSTPTSSRASAARDKDEEITFAFAAGAASCFCSSAAASRPSGSGGSRDPRRRAAGARAGGGARAWASPPAAPRTSATGCMVCIPVAGPVGRDPGRRAAPPPPPSWRLVCPRGRRRGRRCAGQRASGRRRVSRADRQPRQPGDHDHAIARLHGHLRRPRAARPRATGRSSAAFPAAAAASARRPRSRGASAVKPGEPITTRVATLRVVAGTLARATLALPRRRAPPARRATASASTRAACRRRRSSPPSASSASSAAARSSSARRAAASPPACAPRCRCRRSAHDEVRLAADAARAPARAARRCSATSRSSGAGRGTRSTSRTSTCSRRSPAAQPRWRRYVPPALAALALTCALAALARPEVECPSPASRRRSRSPSTSRARWGPRTSSRRASSAAQEAIARFLDRLPDKYRVGLVTFSGEPFVAAPLTHDRELVLEALRFGTTFGRGTAIGDALARSVELAPARWRPTATRSALRRLGAAPAIRTRRCRRSCCSPTARRRAASLAAARGRGAREVVRHPRLRGRARHPGRRHRPRQGFSRPVPPDPGHAPADRGDDRRRVLRDPRRGAPERGLRGSRLAARQEDGMARAELRAPRAGGAARARRRRALAALGPAPAVRAVGARRRGGARPGCRRLRRRLGRSRATDRRDRDARTAPAPPRRRPRARAESAADVVARVLPGVVNVKTVGFDGSKGEGSGVVIDRRGVIVTNNHVVQGARTLTDLVQRRPAHASRSRAR